MATTLATYKIMFARKGQSLRNASAGLSPLVDRPGTNSGKPHTTQVEGVQGITDQSRRAGVGGWGSHENSSMQGLLP